MARIDVDDVQGIVLRAYGELPELSFILLSANGRDGDAMRRWLATLLPEVTSAAQAPRRRAVNVAFSHAGLAVFGLPAETLDAFAREFRDDAERDGHRDRILGDTGNSCPTTWAWGGACQPEILVALMLYAADPGELARLRAEHEKCFDAAGLRPVARVDAHLRDDRKEHFGFRDGISQPCLENDNGPAERVEALAPGTPQDTVKAGEFLYGYEDELSEVSASPHVPPSLDPQGRLRRDEAGLPDFGRNGTYLIARQLEQDVKGFWQFVSTKGGLLGQDPVRLAAKMVGRWPNGAPLTKAPDGPVAGLENDTSFGFRTADDGAGHRCPLGAHIRRANPRDALVDDPEESIRIVKRHRLIRRGCPYGPPLHPSLDPEQMLRAPDGGDPRGLLFLAFNLHLARQFEFVQQNWLNNPKFARLHTDADPIAGAIHANSTFTQQRDPVRLRTTGLQSFVRVRGSAYLFVPGRAALHYLTGDVQPERGDVPRLPLDRWVEPTPLPVEQSPRDVGGNAER